MINFSSDTNIEEVQEDSDGMMVRDHDVPSNTNNQDEEPSSIHSRKRIPQIDSLIEVLTTKMSREEAFEKKADMVICELSKMKSLSQRERFKAMDIITSNPRYVKNFWGLGEEEREEWVRYKLQN